MATIIPVAYNPSQTPISGTEQVGDFAIGTTEQDYSNLGGVRFWATPDLDLGYVVSHVNNSGDQPNPLSLSDIYVGFWRSADLTDGSFITLAEDVSKWDGDPQTFTGGTQAKTWLNTNGYWTSWEDTYTNTANLYYDAGNTSSYPGTGTVLYNIGTDGAATGTQGTISGVVYESAIADGVFNFDGGADKITFGQYDFGDDFTVTAWVYPRSEYSINALLTNAGANTSTNGFKLGWNNWNTQNGRMNLEAGNGSAGGTVTTSSTVITEDSWQFLTYKINRGSQSYNFYVNGVNGGTNGILLPNNFSVNNVNWWLGAIGGNSYYMDANVGEIRVYKTLRSDADITAEFNGTKSRYGL